jgi:antitoxin component HigA of HigAB toxin-antitoxin module
MNGTARESLVGDLVAAIDALRVAIEAMQRAAPNGRDYYPQGPAAINEALNQHMQRVGLVASVMDELTDIAQAIR